MPRILLVDDDSALLADLNKWLVSQGYTVDQASTGKDALQLLDFFVFDVIILDWNLPDMTGVETCRKFRSTGGKTSILFLTSFGDIEHKETGLDAGGDDYLAKPFEVRELGARLRSLLRRSSGLLSNELKVQGIMLNLDDKTLTVRDEKVRLTHRECALFEHLIRNPRKSFTARALRDSVWPAEGEATDEAVRTCMKTLRQKLKTIGAQDLIKTAAGLGYSLEVE